MKLEEQIENLKSHLERMSRQLGAGLSAYGPTSRDDELTREYIDTQEEYQKLTGKYYQPKDM